MFCIDLPLAYAQTVLDLFVLDQFRVLIKVSLALFSVLACQLSRAKDQEEVHGIFQNLAQTDGFLSMTQQTFFNLAASFDVPLEILTLLERESEASQRDKTHQRERVLFEMRQIRLKKMKVNKPQHKCPERLEST